MNNSKSEDDGKYHLVVLDPGHFHAALVQKTNNDLIDSTVKVFSPDGPDVNSYLSLIEQYNQRTDDPTGWNEDVYTGPDYLQKMLSQTHEKNSIVVLAGNNKRKIDYIVKSVNAGLNVFADKPMVINSDGFQQLKTAFDSAKNNGVILYDIMTERYEITNILQKEFAGLKNVFGELQKGSADDPAVLMESVHNFYKQVSGKPLIRPSWFFDVNQQGNGLVDITTHLVDLFEWACFPETVINYDKDVEVHAASLWPTKVTPAQFKKVTNADTYPDFLASAVKDSVLEVNANGEMNLILKGVHARIRSIWDYEAPEGGGDTYHSVLKGSKANLVIRQGKEQDFKPVVYIEPLNGNQEWESELQKGLDVLKAKYPGIDLKKEGKSWSVVIPEELSTGHERHFAMVLDKYLGFLKQNNIPDWEVSYMLTKYYVTSEADRIAKR